MAISISDSARDAVQRFQAKEKGPVAGLRVSVAGGGCSGLTYKVSFDTEVRPGDKVFEKDGVKLLCDLKSYLYLNGTELDYVDDLNGARFVFHNPNAVKTCSCGTSFTV